MKKSEYEMRVEGFKLDSWIEYLKEGNRLVGPMLIIGGDGSLIRIYNPYIAADVLKYVKELNEAQYWAQKQKANGEEDARADE